MAADDCIYVLNTYTDNCDESYVRCIENISALTITLDKLPITKKLYFYESNDDITECQLHVFSHEKIILKN